MELKYDANMICGCGAPVGEARLELGLKVCISCARQGCGQTKPMGRMIYGHKTAGEIEIVPAALYQEQKKYFQPNGARSCVKNFSRKTEHI